MGQTNIDRRQTLSIQLNMPASRLDNEPEDRQQMELNLERASTYPLVRLSTISLFFVIFFRSHQVPFLAILRVLFELTISTIYRW